MFHLIPRFTFHALLFALATISSSFAQDEYTLAPNGSGSGTLNEITAEHWWQVITTQDGALEVTTESASTVEIDLYIYNADRDVQLASYDISSGTIEKTHHNHLGPGIYWIKARRWSGEGSYTIASQFTPTFYAPDPEENGEFSQAVTLSANGSDTGHLYHYYDGTYDANDWWQISIPSDGDLHVTTASDSTLEIDLFIYDIDGITQIASYLEGYGVIERTRHTNLMPGTYFVSAKRWNGYGAYTITSEFIPSSLDNDTEDNDSTAVAQSFPLNSSDTGHLGFYSNEKTDVDDYWAVTIPNDGILQVTTVSDSTLEIDLFMYDDDGETNIADYDVGYGITETTTYNGLTPGTYFIRVKRWSGYGSYTITSTLIPTSYENDPEPNNESVSASGVSAHTTATGHLGHYDSGTTDIDDYYMVTIPAEWDTLYVHSVSDSTLELDMAIYGSNGTSSVASGGRYGIEEWAAEANPAETTYYIKMHRWSGWGAYSFIVSNSTAARPGDISVGVREIETPSVYRLMAPYPNPFNPSTTVSFVIPEAGNARLTVYDMLGRQVAVLIDRHLTAGTHTTVWNARNDAGQKVGAGIYLFHLKAGSYSAHQKALLLK